MSGGRCRWCRRNRWAGRLASRKGKKRCADQGIDGIINFFDEDDKGKKKPRTVIIQVKSGKVKSGDIRDLKGTIEREARRLASSSRSNRRFAGDDERATLIGSALTNRPHWRKKYRRLQILTIGDLFGALQGIDMPPQHGTHQQAERYKPTV